MGNWSQRLLESLGFREGKYYRATLANVDSRLYTDEGSSSGVAPVSAL